MPVLSDERQLLAAEDDSDPINMHFILKELKYAKHLQQQSSLIYLSALATYLIRALTINRKITYR